MITKKQQKWLDHLSSIKKILIVPCDPTCEEKFLIIKDKIQGEIGEEYSVEHRGASSMSISGQDEIDIYVPVSPEEFNEIVEKVMRLFGEPKSHYELERARFGTEVGDKHIDIFVINRECEGWKRGIVFEDYLKSHPEALKEYEELKEGLSGQSVREYYTKKVEFINGVVGEY
jgi:GrpB-like predicted nucleotidyltransferase (UPF0157 family)